MGEFSFSQPFTIFPNPSVGQAFGYNPRAEGTLAFVVDIFAEALLVYFESAIWLVCALSNIEKLCIFVRPVAIWPPDVVVLFAESFRRIEFLRI